MLALRPSLSQSIPLLQRSYLQQTFNQSKQPLLKLYRAARLVLIGCHLAKRPSPSLSIPLLLRPNLQQTFNQSKPPLFLLMSVLSRMTTQRKKKQNIQFDQSQEASESISLERILQMSKTTMRWQKIKRKNSSTTPLLSYRWVLTPYFDFWCRSSEDLINIRGRHPEVTPQHIYIPIHLTCVLVLFFWEYPIFLTLSWNNWKSIDFESLLYEKNKGDLNIK